MGSEDISGFWIRGSRARYLRRRGGLRALGFEMLGPQQWV